MAMNMPDASAQNPNRFFLIVLLLAVTAGLCIVVYYAMCTPTYTIDSYFYLSKAEQLAKGYGLRTTWNDGVDTKYFPGYSAALALSFLLVDSYIPMQLTCYLSCAVFLFLVSKELGLDPAVRLLAVTALAVNPIVIKWLSLPMADGLATAISLLATYLFLVSLSRRRPALLPIACTIGGIAVIVRIEALFLLAVFGIIALAKRKQLKRSGLLAGISLFFLPLFVYWAQLKIRSGGKPAYLQEFLHTVLRIDIFTNFAYNAWVPFGLMHKAIFLDDSSKLAAAAISAALAWLLLGELIFAAGMAFALLGRLGSQLRAIALLFLAFAAAHALWYYRYERFMLMAVPMASIIWAGASWEISKMLVSNENMRRRCLIFLQMLIVMAGLFLGEQFARHHVTALQEDTSSLNYRHIARVVNTLNKESESPVLTDLGPHLAYYIDVHTYLDTEHGNYWRRAFPPDRTLEKLDELRIGYVVTTTTLDQWLEAHQLPNSMRKRFKVTEEQIKGVLIIEFIPDLLTNS
jgi:hypothetical protein